MRAVLVSEFGGPEQLRPGQAADPVPGPGAPISAATSFADAAATPLAAEDRVPGTDPARPAAAGSRIQA
jgi:hypothetical protein